jgi:hypothetical protein
LSLRVLQLHPRTPRRHDGIRLIVGAIPAQGISTLGSLKSPSRTFEFWRDQHNIRERFIGVGNGVVFAKLNVDGLPE